MSNQKKFKTYNALSATMRREKIPHYGVVATALLECFVYNSGQLTAGSVVHKGLCEEGKFKEWREGLITKGWLNYTIGQYSRHTPGSKLLPYVNKEKAAQCEMATVADVDLLIKASREDLATKEELATKANVADVLILSKKINDLEKVVQNLIQEYDPPVTEEKLQRRLSLVNEISTREV